MTVTLTDEFNDISGEFHNYDEYQQADRIAVSGLKHRDIRVFNNADTTEGATVLSLSTLTMTNLGGRTMTSLGTRIIETGEHWTAGTVASDGTRDNFPILSLTCPIGTTTTSSSATAVDLLNDFASTDSITVALPSFPASSLNLATSTITLSDGNRSVSVPFNQSTVALVTGNSELRLPRSVFESGGLNLAAITAVTFSMVATAACTVLFMAVRLVASTWVRPGMDQDTRRGHLRRAVPRNGDVTTNPTNAQPILWRAATPAGPDDPRPIDAEVGIVFNVGSRALTNTFSLYFRELTEDFLTQLDLNGEQMGSFDGLDQPDIGNARYNPRVQTDLEPYTQDQLGGEAQTTLERTADYLSASWIVVTCQWTPTGTLISILDTEGNGYTFPSIPAFTANQNYVLFASLQENCARVTIYNIAQSGIIGTLFFDTTAIIDDTTLKRRRGRFGWYANIRDGDAWIDSIRQRAVSYGEYRSLPFESNTPVDGAEIFVSTSPNVENYSGLLAGPYNSSAILSRDTSRATTGESWKIDNTQGVPMQGVQSNIFTVTDFENTEITFDIFYPSSALVAGGALQAFLLDSAGIYSISLPLPQIFPDQWQSVRMRMPFGQTALTGSYRFVLVQGTSTPSIWWVDNVSIPSRSIAWDGRAVVDDPWGSNDARWTPFRNVLNREGGGVLFPHRGNQLQIRGRAMLQDATINRVQFKPKYSGLGRFKPNATVPSTAPTGSFTASTVGTRTILFTSTATDDGYVALSEWNFGDGATGVGNPITHVYAAAGVYTVTLVSMDNNGNRSFYSNTVSV